MKKSIKYKTREELMLEIEKCKEVIPSFQERKLQFEMKKIANEKASDNLMLRILEENREKFEEIKDDYKEVMKLIQKHYQEERNELTLEFMAISNQLMCLDLMIGEFKDQIERNENKIKKMNREVERLGKANNNDKNMQSLFQ